MSHWDDLEYLLQYPQSLTADVWDRGTIKPAEIFFPRDDAEDLRKAIKDGDMRTVISILTNRSNDQRQIICDTYTELTGRTLLEDLKEETSGDFEKLLVALITPPALYDCHEVKKAMEGIGTNNHALIEIFASRNNQQIKALNDAYLEETEKKLCFDLRHEVSGDFGKALLLLAEGKRDENFIVDEEMAKEDAKILYNAGEMKCGTDESKFIDILCLRSIPQLRQTLIEYRNISGHTLQHSIESELSGHLEDLLVAVVKCVKNMPAYFAECLNKTMKGLGTDECTLIRLMVTRSEIDLLDIRAEYKKIFHDSLHSDIVSDLSGDLCDCVVSICKGDD